MTLVGYARVSSVGQSLDIQCEKLAAAGCEEIFSEKHTGTTAEGREQLASALRFLRKGDVLIVTKMDRLARSVNDLSRIVEDLNTREVGFRALDQRDVDTTTPTGRLMLHLLSAFAEFETNLRKERQADGIIRAKSARVYKGRQATIPADEVRTLRADGVGATAIARRLGIARASVYRLLAESAPAP